MSHRVRSAVPAVAALVVSAALVVALPSEAEEWTRFRGPNGSGLSSATGLPSEIAPDAADWKTEVPFGRSSPVLGKDLVFLTATDEEGLITLAVDRATGETRWTGRLEKKHRARIHHATDAASPTPVTDGSNVYAFFEEAGVVSYDGEGKQRWFVPLGPFRNFYGMSSSPILVGSRLIVLCDQAEGSFLLALDADTGDEVWRTSRSGRAESYATPILVPAAEGRPEAVLIFGSRFLDAYDPATGGILWSTGKVGAGPVATPVLDGEIAYVAVHHHAESGWAPFQPLLDENDANGDGGLDFEETADTWLQRNFGWVDTDDDGVVTASDWSRLENEVMVDHWGAQAVRMPVGDRAAEVVWEYRKNVAYIPSPVLAQGVYYMVEDGILSVLDAATGELKKRGRIEGLSGKVYASPVVGDGKLYVASLAGVVAVLTPEADWDVLATGDFGEEIHATPALAGDGLYLRTRSALYRFTEVVAEVEDGEASADSSAD